MTMEIHAKAAHFGVLLLIRVACDTPQGTVTPHTERAPRNHEGQHERCDEKHFSRSARPQ